jgi:hypothetical protein
MTDRSQPGAIDSVIRNDELAQIFNQFSEGWIVETGTTAAARRRANIDETALNSFAFVSSSGLDVTIDPGEAFVGGWCARDVQTTVTIPPNDTATIVVGWDLDAFFDPTVDPNRGAADEVFVQLERNTDPDYPSTPLFDISTKGSSVTTRTDRRNLSSTVTADTINATETVELPAFATRSGIPANLDEGTVVYVESDERVILKDSNSADNIASKTASETALATDIVRR